MRVRFNRKPTGRCPDPLTQYPGDAYNVWLYNNPVRNLDTITFDQSIKIASGINETVGVVDVTIPKNLPAVQDGSLWYLRIGTSLSTAPQVCFLLFFLFFSLGWIWLCLSSEANRFYADAYLVQRGWALHGYFCIDYSVLRLG